MNPIIRLRSVRHHPNLVTLAAIPDLSVFTTKLCNTTNINKIENISIITAIKYYPCESAFESCGIKNIVYLLELSCLGSYPYPLITQKLTDKGDSDCWQSKVLEEQKYGTSKIW